MNNLTLNLYMLLETQGWIPEIGFLPKGFKGVLMIRANRRKSEESAPRADGLLEDAGGYGQSVGDTDQKNSTSSFVDPHL